MANLVAQGAQVNQRWRRPLVPEQPVILGRTSGTWAVPWDDLISRRHARLCWRRGGLEVQQLSTARNPIFVRGREATQFEIKPGEHFIIGQTTFTVTEDAVNLSVNAPVPIEEQTFTSQNLQRVRFRNADQRLEVLTRLPEVISGAANDSELCVRLANLLLTGIPRASAVAIVAVELLHVAEPSVRVMHWDRRLDRGGNFEPSQRLILDTIRQQNSVLHVWGNTSASVNAPITVSESFDWAFCTPVLGPEAEGWGIYVAGRFESDLPGTPTPTDPGDLREELKFTELVAAILGSLREVRSLQQRQASLSQFFAPQVLGALGGEDPDVALAPRETEVTVLFCDLRGFSLESERHAHELLDLLGRVSNALGVMTHHILEQGGVVGDFQGDAAMGFWGWPLPQPDRVERACRAALGIQATFEAAARRPDDLLTNFRVGIGIATGAAVAGKIGTVDHVKVTVFGPVVNLASRLEGMTKILRAPILLDEATARAVRNRLQHNEARCRRLAVVKPLGMDASLEVSELLPPAGPDHPLADEHLESYEAALDAFLAGRWSDANELLHHVPAKDRAKDFISIFIAQHDRTPPPGWDGVVPLRTKG